MQVFDPLADVPPPRYAVESDDEDEDEDEDGSSTLARPDQPVEAKVLFKSIYDIPSRRPLVFASGGAGVAWARIVNLGEQQAGIYVADLPVGALFCPSWTRAVVVVSEAETRTRLPLSSMNIYASAIIERLQPTSVAILDSYPIKVYISSRAISEDAAPIRYLSIGTKPVNDPRLELFAPPNLLRSTTASLLNDLFLRSIREDLADPTAAILLPTASDSVADIGGVAHSDWERETLETAHNWLFEIIGETVDESSLCAQASKVRPPASASRASYSVHGEIGEGGMYI